MPLFAEMSDAVWLGIIGVLTLTVKEYFDYLKTRETKAKVAELSRKVDEATSELNTKADAAAVKATEASSQAKKAAHNTVAVFHATRAQDAKLATIEKQTNGAADDLRGRLDAKEAEITELRARLDALHLLVPPEKIEPVVEALSASKSGTKLKPVPPPT